jgi:hypothetical protein
MRAAVTHTRPICADSAAPRWHTGCNSRRVMRHMRDAIALLTEEHEQIDELVDRVRCGDHAVFRELADKLTTHLAIEQELFYPAVASWVSAQVMQELIDEHVAIKHVLAELVWLGPEDEQFNSLLDDLDTLLAGHVAWQEDELFERTAETMPPADLDALCLLLTEFEALATAA